MKKIFLVLAVVYHFAAATAHAASCEVVDNGNWGDCQVQ